MNLAQTNAAIRSSDGYRRMADAAAATGNPRLRNAARMLVNAREGIRTDPLNGQMHRARLRNARRILDEAGIEYPA